MSACGLLCALALAMTAAVSAQTVPPVASATPSTTATPLDTFDAAWRVLRNNYVAETTRHIDWEALRAELRPRAERATSDDEVRGLVREMLDRIGQSHFALLPAPVVASALSTSPVRPEDVGTLGFDVRLMGQALVVSPESSAGSRRPGRRRPRVDAQPRGPADRRRRDRQSR